jgi:hypothetical protein
LNDHQCAKKLYIVEEIFHEGGAISQ